MTVPEFIESTTDCSQALLRLCEYLDGEMSVAEAEQVAAHLAACDPCRERRDLDQAIRGLIRQACPCQSAPPHLRMTIVQSITTVSWHRL